MTKFTIVNEIYRKLLHMIFAIYIFFVDLFPQRLLQLTLVILGILYYLLEELRLRNIQVPIINNISRFVLRSQEVSSFAFAPLTLVLGFVLVLEIYSPLSAKFAFIAATVGDSVAALIGKTFPVPKLFWNKSKSWSGLLFNIIAVTLCALLLHVSISVAFIVGLVSGLVESLQLEHVDNLMIPLSVGAVPYFIY